jgi:hypothetical protein
VDVIEWGMRELGGEQPASHTLLQITAHTPVLVACRMYHIMSGPRKSLQSRDPLK